MKNSKHMPVGIHFGLGAEEYHADPAKGSSSIKAMAIDIFEAQFDHLYGEDKDSDALLFGSAVHARILEGREVFEAEYCKEFDKSLVEGALETTDQMKEWLSQHGQTGLSSKKKPDLIKLVQDIDPSQPIVEAIKAEWEAKNEGKTPLKPKRWAQIETAARWVQRDPLLGAVMTDGTFSQGAPEVSIFYEDRGVRRKARFDRLMRHAIVDAKTFAPRGTGRIEDLALKAIMNMRYDIQAADYLNAWQFAKKLYAEGKVYGDPPYPTFLDECFDRDEPAWIWIMVKSVGAPQPLVIDWKAKFAKGRAADDVERAITSYIELRDLYGEDQEWPPARPAIEVHDDDLPSWFGRGEAA